MSDFVKRSVLLLLRAYKYAISPMFPPSCRYVPTCSEYAMEAVERFGALRGGWMALTRLLRCHPLARGGYDPVVRMSEECGTSATMPENLPSNECCGLSSAPPGLEDLGLTGHGSRPFGGLRAGRELYVFAAPRLATGSLRKA